MWFAVDNGTRCICPTLSIAGSVNNCVAFSDQSQQTQNALRKEHNES